MGRNVTSQNPFIKGGLFSVYIHFDTGSLGIDNVIEAIILTLVRSDHNSFCVTQRTLMPLALTEYGDGFMFSLLKYMQWALLPLDELIQ